MNLLSGNFDQYLINDKKPNQFYQEQIPLLIQQAEQKLSNLKKSFQPFSKLLSKEDKMNNIICQKLKETLLISTDLYNEEDNTLLDNYETVQTKFKKIQSSYEPLFKSYQEKLESSQLPNTMKNDYESFQNHLQLIPLRFSTITKSSDLTSQNCDVIDQNSNGVYSDEEEDLFYSDDELPEINDDEIKFGKLFTLEDTRIYETQIKEINTEIDQLQSYLQKYQEPPRLGLQKDVFSFNFSTYLNESVSTDSVPTIEELKKEILENSGQASPQFLAIQQQQEMRDFLDQLKLELKVITLENDRKLTEFKNHIANLQAFNPLFYSENRQIQIDPRLIRLKEKKEKKLKAIENRIQDIENQNYQINCKNNDLSFIIETLSRQRMHMLQIPKADVKKLCHSLRNDRAVVNEYGRQMNFLSTYKSYLNKKLIKMSERYSKETLTAMQNENDMLYSKVNELKALFDQVRASREKHSFVLTNEEELKFLTRKIHDHLAAIDVSKMRMNGLLTKVDKQIRTLNQLQIPIPDPPASYISSRESLSPKSKS